MKALGLTGGIGMGKSTIARMLCQRGVRVVDTDQLAREVVAPGQPALAEIAAHFGPEMLGPGQELRRDALADRVFPDPAARRQLELILHPRIRALWRAQFDAWRVEAHRLAVVVIPLLFETGAETELDSTLCVACSAESQRQRLASRGWSAQEITNRISAQWPSEKKMGHSSFVVWTEGPLEISAAQLEAILARLGLPGGRP